MGKSLLESLAERDVPAVPAGLQKRVHQRLNRALVIGQFVDLVLSAVPLVAVEFARAVGHLLMVSLTGRFESRRVDDSREAP